MLSDFIQIIFYGHPEIKFGFYIHSQHNFELCLCLFIANVCSENLPMTEIVNC